jgi:hypothetical protein
MLLLFAKAAAALGDVSRLPFSAEVPFENLPRFEDGKTATRANQDKRSAGAYFFGGLAPLPPVGGLAPVVAVVGT